MAEEADWPMEEHEQDVKEQERQPSESQSYQQRQPPLAL
jgi:hypothetical protein